MSEHLIATPEIYGALAGALSSSSLDSFASDPVVFLESRLGFDVGVDIKAVRNEEDTIHVALPFYSHLGKTAGSPLSDGDLDSASGGGNPLFNPDVGRVALAMQNPQVGSFFYDDSDCPSNEGKGSSK